MTNERSVCEYCKANTIMDDYGCCRACGAPKPDKTLPQMQPNAPYYAMQYCVSSDGGNYDRAFPMSTVWNQGMFGTTEA